MKIGDVYKFTNNRIRVLMFDKREVFYGIVDASDEFIYIKYRTIIYSRITRDFFDKNSTFIKSKGLSDKELEIHVPHLPLRLNCFSGMFWSNKSFAKEPEFINYLDSLDIDIEDLVHLDNSKVVVVPNSQQMSNKKSVLLQNTNGFFSGQEILKECLRIQSEYVKPDKPYFSRLKNNTQGLSGIGMYRLGIKGNIPSYYLGGEMSMMEWHIMNNNRKE